MNLFRIRKAVYLSLLVISITSLPSFARIGVGPAGATLDANLKILKSKGLIGTSIDPIEIEGEGIVKYQQNRGKTELLALPNNGYYFSHWEGTITGKQNPIAVISTQGIIAIFTPVPSEPPSLIYIDETQRGILTRDIGSGEERQLGQLAEGKLVRGLLPSPQGDKLAIYQYRLSDGNFGLSVVDPENFESLYEFNEPGNDEPRAWSSDGMKLAYTANNGYLRVYDFSKGTSIEFDIQIPKGTLSWSPDSNRIVFVGNQGELYLADLETQKLMRLFEPQGGVSYGTPSWSSVSDLIAYSKTSSEKGNTITHIYIINASTKVVKLLTKDSEYENNNSPQWSPDGSRIAYLCGTGFFNEELYIMDADGANPRAINPGFKVQRPKWSQYGASILCSLGLDKYAVLDLAGSKIAELDTWVANWFNLARKR